MKTEIKALYKKDPKLAKEVAKVLGFKIESINKSKAALSADAVFRAKITEALDATDKLEKDIKAHGTSDNKKKLKEVISKMDELYKLSRLIGKALVTLINEFHI